MRFQVIILFSLLLSCLCVKLDFLFICKYGLPAKVIKHYILNARPINLAFSEFNLHITVIANAHWRVAPFLNLCHRGGLWIVLKLTCQWYHHRGFQTNGSYSTSFPGLLELSFLQPPEATRKLQREGVQFYPRRDAAVYSNATSSFRELN